MDKNPIDAVTTVIRLRHHVDPIDGAKCEPVKNRTDPSLSDVIEDTGNADAENNSHDERTLWFVCGTFARKECECTNSY